MTQDIPQNSFVGVDPGASGAFALYDPANKALEVFDMPVNVTIVNGRKRTAVDGSAVGRWFDSNLARMRCVIVEDVHAMPKQGVTSSFSFGFSTGLVRGVICANLLPYIIVSPNRWKKEMNVPADKNMARIIATRMMPRHAHLFERVKDHGRAEAALLAIYGSLRSDLKF